VVAPAHPCPLTAAAAFSALDRVTGACACVVATLSLLQASEEWDAARMKRHQVISVVALVALVALPAAHEVFSVVLAAAPSSASSSLSAAPSNVCVTPYGVCSVSPPGITRGAPCQCFVPPETWVSGTAEYWVDVPSVIP